VLEGDIKACFDEISHEWLLKNIPMDRRILGKWLKCGAINNGNFFPTNKGTPQGGIISPTLLNLTLSGLEQRIAEATVRRDRVHLAVYADDFIVTGKSKKILEEKVKPVIVDFLSERGLSLSESKTVITTIDQGFDFLGHNIRKYNGKLLIKPSRTSIKRFLQNVRTTVKENRNSKTENLIQLLNPKIRGWANFFRHVVSKKAFNTIDHEIFWVVWNWARRRHPNKGKHWVWRKYFPDPNLRGCLAVRSKTEITYLFRASSISIRRHTKIRENANPYDTQYLSYLESRDKKKVKQETAFSMDICLGAGLKKKAFGRLEPCAGKLARTVLR
jgi:RNA-directed DNA polymerase